MSDDAVPVEVAALDLTTARASRTAVPVLLLLLGVVSLINYLNRGNLAVAAPLIKTELGIQWRRQPAIRSAASRVAVAGAELSPAWTIERLIRVIDPGESGSRSGPCHAGDTAPASGLMHES